MIFDKLVEEGQVMGMDRGVPTAFDTLKAAISLELILMLLNFDKVMGGVL